MQERRTRVLIVDDTRRDRELVKLRFEYCEDMEIVGEGTDGKSGIELAERLRPDIVVMDIDMPGVNGCEAVEYLASRYPRMRLVAFSVLDDLDTRRRMQQAGVQAFVSKLTGGASRLIRIIRTMG